MAEKLYVTGGFKAILYPTYESLGGITEELAERFRTVRGLEIRQLFDDNEEVPVGVREPAIALVGTKEIIRRSWPADNELGGVLDAVEEYYPYVTEPSTVTFADIDFNPGRDGEGFVLLVPEQADSRMLSATRSAILEGAERATGAEPHTWRAGHLDLTIAYANSSVSDLTLGHLTDHLASLLPLDVEFHPVEFTPDPRYDD